MHKARLVGLIRMENDSPQFVRVEIHPDTCPTDNMSHMPFFPVVLKEEESPVSYTEARSKLESKLEWAIKHPGLQPTLEWAAKEVFSNKSPRRLTAGEWVDRTISHLMSWWMNLPA